MRTRKGWLTPVSVLAVAVVLAACPAEEEPAMEEEMPEQPMAEEPAVPELPPDAPEGVTQETVAQGQEIFTGVGNCYTCHGQDATGTQLAPDLTDGQWIQIDGSYESIVDNVITGVPDPEQYPSPMPPMGGAQLSDEQVDAVSAYVWAISRGG